VDNINENENVKTWGKIDKQKGPWPKEI